MESGEFSRGKESIRAQGGIVMVGNFEVDVQQQQRIGHLLSPLPPEMRNDTAFHDRIHAFAPGWDFPKLNPGEHLTDHNTGEWIDRVKAALDEMASNPPEGYRPLYLFPGVEISVHGGIHLLALFGVESSTSDVDSLLGDIGFPKDRKGTSGGVTRDTFQVVAWKIHEAGGLALPAHVDRRNGLFERVPQAEQEIEAAGSFRHGGPTLGDAVSCEQVFAMEAVSQTFDTPKLYDEAGRPWTRVLGTDSHHPDGDSGQNFPGSRFTWIKMAKPTLEGLRLALLDGELSVRRSAPEKADPNEHAPKAIEFIEVTNARYLGRSRPFELVFNPWLNAIVGGRGTGKSTLVEFLRLALRRGSEIPPELKNDFERYSSVTLQSGKPGLLTSESALKVVYRKDGARFLLQWSPAGDVESIQEWVDGSWVAAEGEISQRFPVRIYSQKQIYHLAGDPRALLKVVDDAEEVGHRAWHEQWSEAEGRFLSLRSKVRELQAGILEEPRLRGELDDVKRKLEVFEKSGHAQILKEYQKRRRQLQELESWEDSWTEGGGRLRAAIAELAPSSLDESVIDTTVETDTKLKELCRTTERSIAQVSKEVEELAKRLDLTVVEWRNQRDDSDWKKAVDQSVQAYTDLQSTLEQQEAGSPSAYGDLVQQRQTIEQRLKELANRREEVTRLRQQADECLQRLLELRRERTESRRRFLESVLKQNKYVQIQLAEYGDKDSVEREIRELLRREGGGFEKDIGQPDGEGLLGGIYSAGDDPAEVEQGIAEFKKTLSNIAAGSHDLATLADRRFAGVVQKLQPEELDRMELWFPEDSLRVRYSSTTGTGRFRPIDEGSPGQKTAALLAFLLSYGEEPLILDQPEDDLDNHLIYELIVGQLREVKLGRQVLVVTHNPNIVVNGDAELVVALKSQGTQTVQACTGSLQEDRVRATICDTMEGGRDAFEKRYRRIFLGGRRA